VEIGWGSRAQRFGQEFKLHVIFKPSVFSITVPNIICNADIVSGRSGNFANYRIRVRFDAGSDDTDEFIGDAYHHIPKLVRTSADLTGNEEILFAHFAAALQYRQR
jgi:hypothetical protein